MAFTKGDPNINRRGRPPKQRALAAILEATGRQRTTAGDGRTKQSRNQRAATMLYDLLETGTITVGDRVISATAGEWLQAYRFLCAHLDGPYQPGQDEQPTNAILDQVLRDLDQANAPSDQVQPISLALGDFMLHLVEQGDPDLLAVAQKLCAQLKAPRPSLAELVAARGYFAGQRPPIPQIAGDFFSSPAMLRLMRDRVQADT